MEARVETEREAKRLVVKIGGMSCAMCAKAVEEAISRVPGVRSVSVNLATGTASVVCDGVPVEEIRRVVEEIGYSFEGVEEEELKLKGFIFAALAGAAIFVLNTLNIHPIFQLLIAAPTLLYAGREIFSSAARSLRHGMLNMDVMYSIGIGSSFTASLLATAGILPDEYVIYDTAVLLLAFLLLGRSLEESAKRRSAEAIRKLASLQANRAVVLRDGEEVEVPVSDVRVGDVVIVKPGDVIPVDGVVIEGESYVDESVISGEFMPVLKKKGDEVVGGSVNKNGVLKIEARRVGEETLLSRIVRLVEEAMSTKPKVQRVADRVVSYFIPVVIAIALASFVYWYSVSPFLAFTTLISVLVVACPCAFGLATPTAVAVGIGKAAEMGILIKSGEALERVSSVTFVVFDKTGTLTKGVAEVTDIVAFEDNALAKAASAELRSEHPIAEAIVRRAREAGLEIVEAEEFSAYPGRGVVARVNGEVVVVGTPKFVEEMGCEVSEVEDVLAKFEAEGKTGVVVASGGRVVGVLGIADEVREEAARCVEELKRMGKKVAMVTGDRWGVARAVAAKLKIDEVVAEVLPQHKVEFVRRLQERGEVVTFVGDGVNDAPALAQADVGIAMNKTNVAAESADIVLVRDDLFSLIDAIKLSERTLGKIKQNIFWATFYNSLLIPIAAGVAYPFTGVIFKPEWAALAMAMSSVSVVTNSLLLKRYDRKKR